MREIFKSKKVRGTLMAMVMAMGCFPGASAEGIYDRPNVAEMDGYWFCLSGGHKCFLLPLPNGEQYEGEIKLPETVDFKYMDSDNNESVLTANVARIADKIFRNSSITGFEGSIEVVNDSAFYRCLPLTHVTLNGATEIRRSAFKDCYNLKEVNLSGTTYIGKFAFEDCISLSKVTLPNTLERIWGFAFSGCPLTEITLPESVENITNAFYNCQRLKKVTILGKEISYCGAAFFKSPDIRTIISYADRPEFTDELSTEMPEVFEQEVYENAVVYVPHNRTFSYRYYYTGWFQFRTIVEMNDDGTYDSGIAERIKVSVANGTVNVEGLKEGETVNVFDFSHTYDWVRLDAGSEITGLEKGDYAIVVAPLSVKVTIE